MDTQVLVRRSPLYYTLPIALFVLTLLLLIWAVVQENIPAPQHSTWPWRLDFLDIQSATTAATITGGLVFARAQYEAAVSPMISWMGSIVEGDELSEKLVWLVRAINGSTFPAIFHSLEYSVRLKSTSDGQENDGHESAEVTEWTSHSVALEKISSAGLVRGVDYDLPESGHRFPLSVASPYHLVLCILTAKAMQEIEDILIKVNVTDQAGDTHQRIIYCLRGAIRNPKGVSIPFDV
jgi:hypothetical protein